MNMVIGLIPTNLIQISWSCSMKDKKKLEKRLSLCRSLIDGIIRGYVSDDVIQQLEPDDPMKEVVEVIQLQINEIEGIS